MKLGDIIQVEFLDHCSNDTEPMLFLAWGRLSKIDKKYIVIQTWAKTDIKETNPNNECFCIIRSCIVKPIQVLS